MLLNAFRRLFSNAQNRKARRSCPPQILQLEGRIVPATITVTTTSDLASHVGISLRDAITTANSTTVDDIIDFSVTGTITLDSVLKSLPTIASTTSAGTLTITGPGASSLTISGLDGGNASRNFNIFNIASGGNLSISGVTVSGALRNFYGAFNNSGTLTISNSTISGNTAGLGGGISNFGTLTVTNSTLSGNTSFYNGGGILNEGTCTVTNSTLSGNSARYGGGVSSAGTLNISNSTLSGNYARYGGGGIVIYLTGTISNSTISGNTENGYGGGIRNFGTVTVTNSTLSGNSAKNGGGIFTSVTLNIANTIIANSTNGGDYAGVGSIVTNTNNLVEDGTLNNASSTPTGSGDISGDPNLASLTNNGGPTATMALLTPSPAISTTLLVTPNLDQRGFTRINNDIGAYAYYLAPTVTSVSPTSGPVEGGTLITITGTNFVAGPNVVTIGGVAATNVNFVSATRITATTPAGTAGANKSVLVTSAGGTNAANTLFTYFGIATQATLSTPAAGSTSGSAFTTQPVITIKDAAGNIVTNSTASVTMIVSTGATTVGTTTVNAVAGVATFTNVGISGTAGTAYTLTFTSGSLTTATQSITPTFGTAT
jgi:hypothetical protein